MGRTKARQTSQDSARDAVDAAARRARDFHLAFNGCEDAYIHHALVTAALSPRDFVLCLGTSHFFTEAVLTEAHIVENLIVFAPFKLASLLAGTSRASGQPVPSASPSSSPPFAARANAHASRATAGKGGCLHGAGAVRLEVLHGATVRAAALPGQQTRGAWQRRPRAGNTDS